MEKIIPYYSPHFSFIDLILSFFLRNSEDRMIDFFRAHTSKKYILFTSSCRSALYLTYKSLNQNGDVFVSPLTCQSAIEPLIWSGNAPVFTDINIDSLNADPDLFLKNPFHNFPVALQIINHGGINSDDRLREFAKNNQLFVVEDCAQFFGFEKVGPENKSDVLCYSLIKTGYGLGGGILATNHEGIYLRAKMIQKEFTHFSPIVLLYRIMKQFLETHPKKALLRFLYKRLIGIREKNKTESTSVLESSEKYLKKSPVLFRNYFAIRLKKMQRLQIIRANNGKRLFEKISRNNLAQNYKLQHLEHSSFTKLFIYHPLFESKKLIKRLNEKGIEAKHLEHRTDYRVQPHFGFSEMSNGTEDLKNCTNYYEVHDKMISLPLTENMSENDMNHIVSVIQCTLYPTQVKGELS